jgi:hypothetical protein
MGKKEYRPEEGRKFCQFMKWAVSWGSSVSIMSGYGLGDQAIEVRSPKEVKGFFL